MWGESWAGKQFIQKEGGGRGGEEQLKGERFSVSSGVLRRSMGVLGVKWGE